MPGLVGGIIVIAVIVLVILASWIKIVPQAQAGGLYLSVSVRTRRHGM